MPDESWARPGLLRYYGANATTLSKVRRCQHGIVSRADLDAAASEPKQNGRVRPEIVVCVSYGLPTGGRSRYTSARREIVRRGIPDDDEGDFDATVSVEHIYPLDRIELLHGLFGEAK